MLRMILQQRRCHGFGCSVIPGVEQDGGEVDMKLDEDYRWRLNAVMGEPSLNSVNL